MNLPEAATSALMRRWVQWLFLGLVETIDDSFHGHVHSRYFRVRHQLALAEPVARTSNIDHVFAAPVYESDHVSNDRVVQLCSIAFVAVYSHRCAICGSRRTSSGCQAS